MGSGESREDRMLNFMVANRNDKAKRYKKESIETLLKAQIENSLELGWKRQEIVILSNFEFGFMGVKAYEVGALNDFCFTGSKMFGLGMLPSVINWKGPLWSHDLDAWQNAWFDCPKFSSVGVANYSNNKINGGSLFWKPTSIDIIDETVKRLREDKQEREEPTLNKILREEQYKGRVTKLDNTYNVGCSGFAVRLSRSEKPIKVCHFHPYNRLAWETHCLDRNQINEIAITVRLERLMRKYYPFLAVELQMIEEHREIKRKKYKEFIK